MQERDLNSCFTTWPGGRFDPSYPGWWAWREDSVKIRERFRRVVERYDGDGYMDMGWETPDTAEDFWDSVLGGGTKDFIDIIAIHRREHILCYESG